MSYLNENEPANSDKLEKSHSRPNLIDHHWNALSKKIDETQSDAWMDELESQLSELLAENKEFETPRSRRQIQNRAR